MRTINLKALAEERQEFYDKAKRKAFADLVEGCVESYMDSCDDGEYDMDEFKEDSDIDFRYPDIFEWVEMERSTAEEEMNEYRRIDLDE